MGLAYQNDSDINSWRKQQIVPEEIDRYLKKRTGFYR